MGLDQYIFHVTKTHYDEQHTFNRSDLSDHVLIPAGEIDLPMYACLKPYCQKLKVLNEYYDVAKMRADHGLSDDAFIWRYTADSITIGDGKHDVEIDDETVRQKYTIQKVEEEYVCHTHEVYYWRKAYDVRETWMRFRKKSNEPFRRQSLMCWARHPPPSHRDKE